MRRIPLFPLGSVLVPGLVLPLHIFEPRYRDLVADLTAIDAEDERVFGVVAIKQGREVGIDGIEALYEVGCLAVLRGIDPYPDGRYDIVSLGGARFRIHDLDMSKAYLQAEVEMLEENDGEAGPVLATAVREGFQAYRETLQGGRTDNNGPELPSEPDVLAWTVAASMLIDLDDRQRILAADDTSSRLRLERELLRRETTIFQAIPSVPAIDLIRAPVSAN